MDTSEEQPRPPEQSPNPAAPVETWKTLPGQPGIEVFHLSPPPVADVYDPELPFRRRVWLPLVLFLLTCVTTYAAGVVGWNFSTLSYEVVAFFWQDRWLVGLQYMLGVLGILLAHEMGHFLMAHRHRVPASFPYFIPMPMLLTGTMGAVIRMQGGRADRKQIFDIGIAGPLAGLVIAIPLLCFGILYAEPIP
jgi:Zn-dependent protease